VTETVAEILAAYRNGALTPAAIIARSYARLRERCDPAIFISLRNEEDVLAEAEALMRGGDSSLPLYGIPVAIKDNIDVGGMPTTAACPDFLYWAAEDSVAVAKLRAAGALIIGKTNLDQFATGLVGVRSPYGVPRNPLDPKLIPGGSSSGSAVAVSAGIVPLALGTDTAGSGRVPAMFNNIVGLKPSLGLVSTSGVVPACRTLDCVSIFAFTVDDAVAALQVIAGPDADDPFSRARPMHDVGPLPQAMRLGIPLPHQRMFYGDKVAAAAYDTALARFTDLGATVVEVDFAAFYATAQLLYEGPWVAERYLTAKELLAKSPDSILPVTRQIIGAGAKATAADLFAALYKLEDYRRVRDEVFKTVDALALPTAPTVYNVDEIAAEPITLNSRLGTYTNFVNFLDMCGLSIPSSISADGTPFGVTLLAPGGQDAMLSSIGRQYHYATGLPLGALKAPQPPPARSASVTAAGEIAIAMVGAHLSGMPLNSELRAVGGRLLANTKTAPHYRLFALSNMTPPKPGLLRIRDGEGTAIEIEVWALPDAAFGRFVADIPPPLSIGTLALADGEAVKGFLVEAEAVKDARDISSFGGWRKFVEAQVGR
jgi:allophanate hydrolase